MTQQLDACPNCRSERIWLAGKRPSGEQRFQCARCGYRFSEHQSTRSMGLGLPNGSGTTLSEAVKGMSVSAVTTHGNIEADLIGFSSWLLSRGLDKKTIEERVRSLRRLQRRGANLYEATTVWSVIAQYTKENNEALTVSYKKVLKQAYLSFACYLDLPLTRRDIPTFRERPSRKKAPLETDLDLFIASAGPVLRPFLVALKELACRGGEAARLKWKDMNLENRSVFISETEKQGVPRAVSISTRLVEMLKRLPSLNQNDPEAYVFGDNAAPRMRRNFWAMRKKLARNLGNPRLNSITMHDFRRWNATITAMETRDPYAVMKRLGHKHVASSEPYVDVEQLEPLQTIAKAATTLEEQMSLIEQGFTFVKETKVGETTYSLFQKKVARRPE